MAVKTKDQLKAASNSTYTTNGTGAITAAMVRTFNTDLIDSMALASSDWVNLTFVELMGIDGLTRFRMKDLGDIILLDIKLNYLEPGIRGSINGVNFNFGWNRAGVMVYESDTNGFVSISVEQNNLYIASHRLTGEEGGGFDGRVMLVKGS